MPYCPNCGVELGADAKHCPLCGAPSVPTLDPAARAERARASLEPRGDRLFDPDDSEKLSFAERMKIRWEIVSVSTLISAIAVCAVNFLIESRLSWAFYPLFSLALAWLFVTGGLELGKRPLLGAAILLLATPLFLVAIDLVDGLLQWSPAIGVPIALIAELALGGAWLIGSRAKRKGLNLIALGFIATTLICLGIEGTLSLALDGRLRLRWSGVVSAALIPVSGFLAYLHYRVNKVASLRRLFRL